MTISKTSGTFRVGSSVAGGFYDSANHRVFYELNTGSGWVRGVVTADGVQVVHGSAGKCLRPATAEQATFVKRQLVEHGLAILPPDIEAFVRQQ